MNSWTSTSRRTSEKSPKSEFQLLYNTITRAYTNSPILSVFRKLISRQTTQFIIIPSPRLHYTVTIHSSVNHLLINGVSNFTASQYRARRNNFQPVFQDAAFVRDEEEEDTSDKQRRKKLADKAVTSRMLAPAAAENWAIRIHIRVGLRARRCSRSAFNIRILFEACMQSNRSPFLSPLSSYF